MYHNVCKLIENVKSNSTHNIYYRTKNGFNIHNEITQLYKASIVQRARIKYIKPSAKGK